MASKKTPLTGKLLEYDLLDKARQRNVHCTIRKKSATEEWRVNLHGAYGGSEDTACYDADLEAAIETMDAMEQWYQERMGKPIGRMFGE